ncbi:MAG: hypothetical protein C5B59_11500 [Bacteroidetes bacterium]|nr:MAG: hypothetical protein C5B59_11500 [Bacteroidota bacterium]
MGDYDIISGPEIPVALAQVAAPAQTVVEYGGENFYYFDPLRILRDANLDQSVKDFWCAACQHSSTVQPEWISESAALGGINAVWLCPDNFVGEANGFVVCTQLLAWARARLASDLSGIPMPPCTINGDPGPAIELFIPPGMFIAQPPCGTALLTAQGIVDILSTGSLDTMVSLADLLVCQGDPTSPLAISVDKSDPACQGQLGSSVAGAIGQAIKDNAPGIVALLAALIFPEGEGLAIAVELLDFIKQRLIPWLIANTEIHVICDPNAPPGFSLVVDDHPVFKVVINLFPTLDCGGGGPAVDVRDMVIQFNACDSSQGPLQVVAPTLVGPGGENSAALFQLIVDKLANLQKCCPPCRMVNQLVAEGIRDVGNINFPTTSFYTGYDNLQFIVTQAVAQGAAHFSNPPRWKFGTFTFKYADGSFSKPQFCNYSGQRFFVPRRDVPCIGIGYHLEPAVIATVYGEAEPDWLGGIEPTI